MKSLKLSLSYGFLVWVIPFVAALFIYPLRSTERALFESIMPVVLVACVVLFSVLYFKKTEKSLREGIFLGVLWLVISVAIDFLFFIWGPVKMPVLDYIKDIGATYIIIPLITVGFTYSPKVDKEV